MIYNNLEFHNVEQLREVSGMEGLRLERFPENVRENLGIPENYNGRFRASRVHGCEIRFVTDALFFDLCITALEENIDILIYRGDMFHEKHTLEAGKRTVLHVEYPPIYKLSDTGKLPKGRFAPNVWRVLLGMNGYLHFHYLDTYGFGHRPPNKEEKPEILWAAYGSSITCGSVTSIYSNCYLEQTALRMGYDVMNKGLSGSCMCEEEIAEYLSSLSADVLSLELGVNMLTPFTPDAFEQRVRRLLNIIKEKSVAKKIYVIDIFINRAKILKKVEENEVKHFEVFKKIVKSLVTEMQNERMIYIDGLSIAPDLTYLSTDLLHPSDHGHILMGEMFAKQMKNNMLRKEKWYEERGVV